jgi:hypothetical protein
MAEHKYEVIVGNVGTVIETKDKEFAERVYKEYVQLSREVIGRCSGECVALFGNGELIRGYDPR